MKVPAGEVVEERLGGGQSLLPPLDEVHRLAVEIARPVSLDLRTTLSVQTPDRQTADLYESPHSLRYDELLDQL